MRSALVALAIVGFAAANVAVVLTRSAIPLAVEGRVSRIDVRREKHPGVDDVYLVTIGTRTLHLDGDVARHLRRGDRVSKDAWSRSLLTSRGAIPLRPSRDTRDMAIAMPLVAALGWMVLRLGRG